MDFLRDTWLYAEAVLLPGLATYETEVFAVTAVVGLLVLLGKIPEDRVLMIAQQHK